MWIPRSMGNMTFWRTDSITLLLLRHFLNGTKKIKYVRNFSHQKTRNWALGCWNQGDREGDCRSDDPFPIRRSRFCPPHYYSPLPRFFDLPTALRPNLQTAVFLDLIKFILPNYELFGNSMLCSTYLPLWNIF